MKARLLHPSRDFDWRGTLQTAAEREATRMGRRYVRTAGPDPRHGLPWNADALTADLSLETLFAAMACDDDWVYAVAQSVLLAGASGDLDTILYRQAVLRDCLRQPAVIRQLYGIAVEATTQQKGYFLGTLARYPDSVLREAIETMSGFMGLLRKLRGIADSAAQQFSSEGWTAFFAMLKRDLDDEYFAHAADHLEALKFRDGELLGAGLGRANKAARYVLHRAPHQKSRLFALWTGLFKKRPRVYRFEIAPRDDAGAQALNLLRNRGIAFAADALSQSADHVRDFFDMLRAELAFYIGCINLHERLSKQGEPICMPIPVAIGERRLSFRGVYDVGLALSIGRRVTGNETDVDRKDIVIITGPNTGGKSTFLRSIGLAQLMMQSGMFAPAESFCASICTGLFTHFKRGEDVRMESGKLDEELGRMSEIIDHVAPHSVILFNEPFSATNEREGAEIARQVLSALHEEEIKVVCVTHNHELARGFYERNEGNALFLRAERLADGRRTFRLIEGEPLGTADGEDLYRSIFGNELDAFAAKAEQSRAATP